MLSLNKLEIFATVVQAGSFSKAATELYMTQSAVSQHIGDLESAMGTQLFLRGPRGVNLTPSGDVLYGYTKEILRLVAEAESAVTDVGSLANGQINIGATPGISVYLLPRWIGHFRSRYPQLTVTSNTGITPTIAEGVLSRRLDIGFVEGEIDGNADIHLGQTNLKEVTLYVVIGKGHPCWEKTAVPIANLDGQPFITRQPGSQTRIWMDAILKNHNITPRIIAEFDNPESIKHAVMAGMGVSILPDYAIQMELANDTLRALPLEGIPLKRTLKLVRDTRLACSAITKAFLMNLQDQFPQLIDIVTAAPADT